MRKWALLLAAICVEVTGTLSLRASQDHRTWLVVVVVGYVASFYFLALVLRAGMPIGGGLRGMGCSGNRGDGGPGCGDLR